MCEQRKQTPFPLVPLNEDFTMTIAPSSLYLAGQDVLQGIMRWPLWASMGWNDIRQRYRRSLLGPFWLTASMAIMVIALGIIYSRLFKTEIHDFLPYLCVGLLIWGFISSVLSEAGTLFTGSESYIKQVRLPLTIYVFRFVWSRVIIFAHNVIIYFGVLLYFQIWPGTAALLAIPGLIVLFFNAALVSLYLGMASARFRDVPQIIGSATQIIFFITPIMWKTELIGTSSPIVALNPFFHLIEIVRGPLLGYPPSTFNYFIVAGITFINVLMAIYVFSRFRPRIAYWV
jgi:lipopolysaccharide transport system permease protein